MTTDVPQTYAHSTVLATRLRELGLGATLAEIERMQSIHSRDAILRALEAAPTHYQAKRFLAGLVRQVREDLATKPVAEGPNAQPTQLSLVSSAEPFEKKSSPRPTLKAVASRKPQFTELDDAHKTARKETIACRAASDASGPVRNFSRAPSQSSVAPPVDFGPAVERLRIDGGNTVLIVEAGENARGAAVLLLQAAAATRDGQVDWPNKVAVMLTPGDLLVVLAVMVGKMRRTISKGRGPCKDTWYDIEHQTTHLHLTIGQRKTARAISICPEEAFQFAAFVSAQIRKNVPAGAQVDVQWLLQQVVAPMVNAMNLMSQ